jgi:DNA polymerase III subunit epsilon
MNATTNSSARQNAILKARRILEQNPLYLDTETTGLEREDEIIEIAIIDDQGATVINSLVRPSRPIPAEATRIHGITNEMVIGAPYWLILWQTTVRSLLAGRLIAIYNDDFDLRMIRQSLERYKQPLREPINSVDILKLYAEFHGEWNPVRRSYRYFSLDAAGKQCRIKLPNAHRALADTLLTRALLHHITEA